MSAPPNLSAVRAKVDRAEQHLRRLEGELLSYVAGEPGLITGYFEVERDIRGLGLQSRMTLKPLPPEIGVSIGDVVHCLRSALDHLAWKLAESPGKNTYFPIRDNTSIDKSGKRVLPEITGGVSETVRAILAEFQPWWPTGKLADPLHTLRVLRELSNNDKHRELTIPLIQQDIRAGPTELREGTKLVARLKGVDVREGRADFSLRPAPPQPNVQVDVEYVWRLNGRIRVLDTNEEIDVVIIPTLQAAIEAVRDSIIPCLKDHVLR